MEEEAPPKAKYEYAVKITGNSHAEIVSELMYLTRGGYLIDSDYEKHDEFEVYGGRKHTKLVHTNPEMTPEKYEEELDAWFERRKSRKKG